MSSLAAQVKRNSRGVLEVFKVVEEQGIQKKILISKKPAITEYVNGIQMYNNSLNGKQYQGYFEQDPFTHSQNEVIKTVEKHPKVQREYSILKDIKTTKYVTSFIYNCIGKQFKNGTKSFPLIEFFSTMSKEDEIRECYDILSTDEPLINPLDFKDLNINKWDRIDFLKKKNIIKI